MIEFLSGYYKEIGVLAAVLCGGLAGALFREIFVWWKRPILRITFRASDRGCQMDIPALQNDVPGTQRYLRVKVQNIGKSVAHNVSVSLTSIDFYPPKGAGQIFDEEVLDLPVALSQPTQTRFNLPARGHRYVDLFFVEQYSPLPIQMRFAFSPQPNRLHLRRYDRGSYSAKLFLAADNARSRDERVNWHWGGNLGDLNIT